MARAHAGKNAGWFHTEKAHALHSERSFADAGAFANGEDTPPYYRGAMTYVGGYHRRRAYASPYGWTEAYARRAHHGPYDWAEAYARGGRRHYD